MASDHLLFLYSVPSLHHAASVLPGGLVLCLQGGEEPASSSCGPVAYVSVPQHSGVPPMPLTLSHTDSGKRLEKLSACEPKVRAWS